MRGLGGAKAGEEPEDRSQQQPHGDEVLDQEEGHALTLTVSSRIHTGRTARWTGRTDPPGPGRQERAATRRISATT